MQSLSVRFLCGCAFVLIAASLRAQVPAGWGAASETQARIGEDHWKLTGGVAIEQGDTQIYADEIETFTSEDRAVATGNVVFTQGRNRIAADRADFNTRTRLGTFYNASGVAMLQPQQQQRPRSGQVAPPPASNRDTDVYFFGETIEKLAPRKYKITNGGFTTCVQPTPRWQLTSTTIVLYLDHYTLMRQTVLSVKGVPMFYTPVLYYPTKKEQRATGVLLPTYGSTTLQGQSLHNAFFWAIDRSQDATFLHDWFSKTGQGMGGEYRYNFGALSNGHVNMYLLNSHESTYAQSDGSTRTVPASRTTDIRGSATEMLPGGLRARANVSYFSDVTMMQTFNTNIDDASRTQRSFGGNIIKTWGTYAMNATFDHAETFYNATSSMVSGSWPRVSFTRSERPLFGANVYVSAHGEYARLVRDAKTDIDVDTGLTRFDVSPQIRFPFKKWQWFTVNSSLSWRDTYYTRSCSPSTATASCDPRAAVDAGLNRRFFTASAQIVGPVFTRVWDTPDNGYAEKFKHSIEPFLNVQRTSSIDNYNRIVPLEGMDSIVGGAAQYTYGVTNRFYAKQRPGAGARAFAREIVNVTLTQTYYTDDRAAQVDQQYATSFSGVPPSHFSPIALSVRAVPTTNINANLRAEFDSRHRSLRTISLTGSYTLAGWAQTSISWSKKGYIPELSGFNNPAQLDHYINASANLHARDNRYGGTYTFNYDVLRRNMLQQRISTFYNAQCCGVAFEFQSFNFGGVSAAAVPADHRFFLSFTLAGLGNFSPFSGALGGVPR